MKGDVLGVREGRDVYGDVVMRLVPYPTLGDDGTLDFDLTYAVDRSPPRLTGTTLVLTGLRARSPGNAG